MNPLDAVREHLNHLKSRLVRGEIDRGEYQAQRELILADLSAEERAALGTGTAVSTTPTPLPSTPGTSIPRPGTPRPLGPSGSTGDAVRTHVPSLSDLNLSAGMVLLGQWKLEKELGRGGFGAVFAAEEMHLHEKQAVKVLDPAMVAKEELLARFRREVSLMRKLVHPRIVRVYDYREDLQQLIALISMELVTGGSVKQLLAVARERKQPIPIALAMEILGQTLEALAEAHAQGVIHRDVTPGNVLLAGGTPEQLLADPAHDPRVKLVDFGIAGLVERSELSQKSRVLGTAAYVAPEILDPNVEVTPAADVYGAGAMAYELLTGELPVGRFEGARELRREVPEAVDLFVTSLLERRPEKRPEARTGVSGLRKLREEASQAVERQEVERRAAAERTVQDAAAAQRRAQGAAESRRQEAVRREAEQRERQEAARRAEEASRREQERLRLETAVQEARPSPSEPKVVPTEQPSIRKPVGLGSVMGALAAVAVIALIILAVSRSRGGGTGTWLDERSGLLWTAKDNGSDITWASAKSYCEGLTLGGSSDWRMPSIPELEGLYDASSSKRYKTRGSVELSNWWVWSGGLKSGDSSAAWGFYFFGGERNWRFCTYSFFSRALCVRRSGR